MGRTCSGTPVKHIISTRVNDEEMEILQELSRYLGINISTLLRLSLDMIAKEIKDSQEVPLFKPLKEKLFSGPTIS